MMQCLKAASAKGKSYEGCQRIVLRSAKELDGGQRAKLKDMQLTWETSLTSNYSFYRDHFQGTVADPLVAVCLA